MTETQQLMADIEAIHAHAERMQRPLTPSEMDRIERLRDQIHSQRRDWLDQALPMPAGATA